MEEGPKNRVDANTSSEVAGATAGAMLDLLNHIDSENSTRSNVVIGLGSLILTIVVPRLQTASGADAAGLTVIAVGVAYAIVSAVITIKPKVFSNKRELNLFYPGSYVRKVNQQEYTAQLVRMFQHDHNILEGLARELYLYGGTVTAQARRLEWSIIILVVSVALGAVLEAGAWYFGR